MNDGGASFSLQRRLQPAFCALHKSLDGGCAPRYGTAMRKHADRRES
jgi:hypothetical protein